jgi:hypothetical protein
MAAIRAKYYLKENLEPKIQQWEFVVPRQRNRKLSCADAEAGLPWHGTELKDEGARHTFTHTKGLFLTSHLVHRAEAV